MSLTVLLVALVAAGAAPQDSRYLKWDPATKTVTFELIAGGEGASSPFNFNGYVDGEANLVVPPGVNVVMNFVQKDGTPHSAEIIADQDPMPNMAVDAAIPRAYTNKVAEGLVQEAKDVNRFTAPSFEVVARCQPPDMLTSQWPPPLGRFFRREESDGRGDREIV
jgi:hypothetical protein